MTDYGYILSGLPVMYLIVVVSMVVVIGAMSMDAAFGWRKAKLRGEARTSYLFSRSITKFALNKFKDHDGVFNIRRYFKDVLWPEKKQSRCYRDILNNTDGYVLHL